MPETNKTKKNLYLLIFQLVLITTGATQANLLLFFIGDSFLNHPTELSAKIIISAFLFISNVIFIVFITRIFLKFIISATNENTNIPLQQTTKGANTAAIPDTSSKNEIPEEKKGELQRDELEIDFISKATHELRTPITVIRGYASLLKASLKSTSTPEIKELMSKLDNGIENLTALNENLLEASRIDKGTLKIEKRPVDLLEITKSLITKIEATASGKNIAVHIKYPDQKLPQVMTDPAKIAEVIMNLLTNAIIFTHNGGVVTVTFQKKADQLEMSIADTGIGIPKDSMDKLFTKFYQVPGFVLESPKGSGLGLYISKSIIEKLDGSIGVESTLGFGSIFHFTQPIASPEELKNAEKTATPNFDPAAGNSGFVLNKNRLQNHIK